MNNSEYTVDNSGQVSGVNNSRGSISISISVNIDLKVSNKYDMKFSSFILMRALELLLMYQRIIG